MVISSISTFISFSQWEEVIVFSRAKYLFHFISNFIVIVWFPVLTIVVLLFGYFQCFNFVIFGKYTNVNCIRIVLKVCLIENISFPSSVSSSIHIEYIFFFFSKFIIVKLNANQSIENCNEFKSVSNEFIRLSMLVITCILRA